MTILFSEEYIEPILDGVKTYTIRKGDRRKRLKIGHCYLCKYRLFSKDAFATVRIIDLKVKPFSELTEQDAKDDLFGGLAECKERLIALNGEGIVNSLITKIHFKLVCAGARA